MVCTLPAVLLIETYDIPTELSEQIHVLKKSKAKLSKDGDNSMLDNVQLDAPVNVYTNNEMT